MMIGEAARSVPNLQIPHWEWDPSEPESEAGTPSPFSINAFTINFNANAIAIASANNQSPSIDDFDMPIDAFSTDHFRMFEFKVRNCARARSHDWTECPYAHPAEKARRRDPRKYHYSGTACPDFRKGNCRKGDSCEFAHGVFESWLHPARYRTQLCKDATDCRRRVCFFAHTPEQLRVLTHDNGSPIRHALDSPSFVSSPTSVLCSLPITSLSSDSPPTSPGNPQYGVASFNAASVSDIVSSMRNVQLDKTPSSARGSQSQMGSVFGSPRPTGFLSLPSTPTRAKHISLWDQNYEEEVCMDRVESGRELRARIYAKLGRENSFGKSETGFSSTPDIGWVSELVK